MIVEPVVGSAWLTAWFRVTLGTIVSMVTVVPVETGLTLSEGSVVVAVMVKVPLVNAVAVV